MTFTPFAACMALVLVSEGGWSDDPKDPGGATMRGVTQAVYDGWSDHHGLPRRSVREISDGELRMIYQAQYWVPIMGDWLPPGVAYAVFDFAVNSGVHEAAIVLQRLVDVTADGHIGLVTLGAVKARPVVALIDLYCAARLDVLRSLPGWPHDGHGWQARVERVHADALAMVV